MQNLATQRLEPSKPAFAPRLVAERVRVAEFFAGIGLMRAGLEAAGIEVVWANDISDQKAER